MPRKFKNWLSAYVNFTRHSEAPDSFHFWTGVSVVAGALQRKVWIEQRLFQWVPNFYIIFVGPPGIVSKSTTLNVGMDLLREIEGVTFGPKVVTWQALLDKLQEAHTLVNMTPHLGPEAATYEDMSCITCPVSELGTFLKPSNVEMIDVMVDLWDGQKGVFEKITRTTENNKIINPWVNMIGCTTPAWLRDNFPEYMIGGGLTSRCIFVFGQEKRQYVAYPSRSIDQDQFDKEREALLSDLREIAKLTGAYELTDDAYEWGEKWYTNHQSTRPDHMMSDRFSGYLARKQTHLHKLALVKAAACRDELVVKAEDLHFADKIMNTVESSMQQVFSSIGVVDTGRHINEVLDLVQKSQAITAPTLLEHLASRMSALEFDAAIQTLIRMGHVTATSSNNVVTYRATSRSWQAQPQPAPLDLPDRVG